jgi:hypothetical protein
VLWAYVVHFEEGRPAERKSARDCVGGIISFRVGDSEWMMEEHKKHLSRIQLIYSRLQYSAVARPGMREATARLMLNP